MKTLEEILKNEKKHRTAGGDFGINACKESILSEIERHKKWNNEENANYNTSLYVLLENYVDRANSDIFFNKAMVLACWELINGVV